MGSMNRFLHKLLGHAHSASSRPSTSSSPKSSPSTPTSNPASTPPSSVGGDVSREVSVLEYESILTEFLKNSAFVLPPYQDDEEFDQEVIRGCMSIPDPKKRESLARLGAGAAKWFYPTHDRKLQIIIATFTGLMFSVDDLGERFPDALRTYRRKIMLRQPQDNPQVADFLDMAFQMEDWLDTFAVDMVFKGQLEFLSGNLAENECGDKLRPLKCTPHFLRNYLRLKTGICEPYALFIWPSDIMAQAGDHCCTPLAVLPDLMTWIDDTNDIMSFYKESVVGDERDNVVYLHARANGISPLEAVKDYVKSAESALGRVRAFSEVQKPEVRRKLDEFIQGYIAFHYAYPRYRLKELNVPLPKLK